MGKRPDEATIKLRLANIISDAEDKMFERFDQLHKQEIHDNDVVGYLRNEGHTGLAERYIEWALIVVNTEEDNTTTSPAVPDPGDAPSYDTMKHGEPRINFAAARNEMEWP